MKRGHQERLRRALLSVLFVVSTIFTTACGQEIVLPAAPVVDPVPFEPLHERSQAEDDELAAMVMFVQGRLSFRREFYSQALRQYQRSLRYANGAGAILTEIVPLALQLNRVDEALRYAKRLDSADELDPFFSRQLAMELTDRQQFGQAIKLYERGLEPATPGIGLATQFELGRLYFLVGDFAKACKSFDVVMKAVDQPELPVEEKPVVDVLKEQGPSTFSLIAEAYLEGNQLDDALVAFEKAYASRLTDPLWQFHRARIAAKRNNLTKARQTIQGYMESGDTQAGMAPYELYAKVLRKAGNADELIPYLETLQEQQSTNVFLINFLAYQYLDQDRPGDALKAFETLMNVRPLVDGYRGIVEAHRRRQDAANAMTTLTEVVANLGDLQRLSSTIDAIVADPAFLAKLTKLADRDLQADQSTLPELRKRQVAQVLAETLIRAGREDDADRYYERAVGDENPDLNVWLAWGLERLVSRQPESAIEVFQAMLDYGVPEDQIGLVKYYQAAAYATSDDFTAAWEAAEDAARRLNDVPAAQIRPAWVLYLAGRWDDAYQAYQQFLTNYEDQYGSAEVRALVQEAKSSLSGIAVRRNAIAESEEWLEQILDEFPDDVSAMNDLGYLWADRGVRLERALRMIRRAVAAEPDNPAYRDSLGWALFRLGKYDQAVIELQKAVVGDEPDGVILDHLGDALQHTQRRPEAEAVWRRALEHLSLEETDLRQRIEEKLTQLNEVE